MSCALYIRCRVLHILQLFIPDLLQFVGYFFNIKPKMINIFTPESIELCKNNIILLYTKEQQLAFYFFNLLFVFIIVTDFFNNINE